MVISSTDVYGLLHALNWIPICTVIFCNYCISHLETSNTLFQGVESEKCPSFSKALECGKPTLVTTDHTLADGLAVAKVGDNAYKIAAPLIDKMVGADTGKCILIVFTSELRYSVIFNGFFFFKQVVIKEEWIALTILRLLEQEKSVVEGAGATGLAAVLSGALREFTGKKYVALNHII